MPASHTSAQGTMETYEIDPEEKYLTFLTHSGIQNQLIQVENGILLAWYLNRTLVLPRALLGEVFGWSQFGKLYLQHMLRDNTTDVTCAGFRSQLEFWEVSCPDRRRYAMIPFDELYDLSWAKKHVKIILRERSDFDWLEERLGIQRAGVLDRGEGVYVDGDILFFKGSTRYDWRIFDTPRKARLLGKYNQSLDIFELRERPERLLHFSSLFGTGKLPIRRSEHYEFQRTLHQSVTCRHPLVLDATETIVSRIGGEGSFIGLHVRSGDGWFIKALSANIQSILDQINRILQSKHGNHAMNQTIPIQPTLDQCRALAQANQAPFIYMATDARTPRSSPALAPIWEKYPCTFTVDDILSPNDDHWHQLDALKNDHTGNGMRKFLLPLVDAAVASRGWHFIGSRGSTFSSYIHRLHSIFWNERKEN